MRKLYAWLGAAMLAVVCGSSTAHAGDPLKPYVVFILDTSGSMNGATGLGPPSCGGADTKLNHARCAIYNIVNSYGDMVFALGRFRTVMGGTPTTFPAGCCIAGPDVAANNGCPAGVTCTAGDHMLELLSSLVDGSNSASSTWVNFSGNTCTASGSDPEVWGSSGSTPLEGVLNGTKRYYQGLQATNATTLWGSTLPGFDPIRTDPLKTSFLPTGCDPSPSCVTNCCVQQCRPYLAILLTDGQETCGGTPANGAASLLATDVDGRRYRIKTKPIGFGIAEGDPEIEAIADAGSLTPALDDGYYATDEAGLQLAISNILKDAIRAESCNNLDDDCDTLVDEDFPNKGGTCNNGKQGVCRVNGTQVCRLDGSNTQCNAGVAACNGVPAGGACTVQNSAGANVGGTCQGGACVPTPGTEICNMLDDDCDGKIDENLTMCSCVPKGEQCNGMDDDCDGTVDEDVTKPCGTGTCGGTQTCVVGGTGTFGPCLDSMGNPVQQPTAEVCNGIDDNCDGIVDGLSAACSTMVPFPPSDSPTNNPGNTTRNPIPENICRPGQKTCPVGAGVFGACQGEIKPCNNPNNNTQPVPKSMGGPASCDGCNGLDDDCDNVIDEDFQSADCSTNCGIGSTMCVMGQIVCNSMPAPNDDTCNNIDDDCDMMVDEGFVGQPCGQGVVCNGMEVCQNGVVVCNGQPVGQEVCNCLDDNCNNIVDDNVTCGAGAQCKFCQCAQPCAQDEFPCPMGKLCKLDTSSGQSFCIADPCFNVTCPPINGEKYVCKPNAQVNGHTCEKACDSANCGAGEVCIKATGECKPDNCHTFPNYCQADELCIAGMCKKDLCKNVNCGTNQYCVAGQCYGSCADVDCPDGKRCEMGICVNDPCGHQCPFGQVCIEASGKCEPDPCAQIPCPTGQWCNPQTVQCEDDPCIGTTCPGTGQVCKGGTCFDGQDLLPDAPQEAHVTTGGGGGCSTGGAGGLLIGLALLGLVRRKGGRS